MEDLKKEIEELKKQNLLLKRRVAIFWSFWSGAENELIKSGVISSADKICPETPFKDDISYLEKLK